MNQKIKQKDVNLTLTPVGAGADTTRVHGEPQSLQARVARKFPKGFRKPRKR